MKTPQERFWAKVDKSGDCWLWTAGRTSKGYGNFWIGAQGGKGAWIRAHRFAWAEAGLVVPEGLELDHICRTRLCVRVDHLRAVTHAENLRNRARFTWTKAKNTQCPKGHVYDYFTPAGQGRCKQCRTTNERLRLAARRLAELP